MLNRKETKTKNTPLLHQHQLKHTVIGIGLNINQLEFSMPTATSLAKETAKEYKLQAILEQVLVHIENRYLQLRGGQYDQLKMLYLQRLYWFQEPHTFQRNGKLFVGMIVGIDTYGRLAIATDETIHYFDVKEVVFIA